MDRMVKLCLAVMLIAVASSGQKSQDAFSKLYVSAEFGEIYPMGDLMDAVDNTFFGGFGLRYSYWDDVEGFLTADYIYFKPIPKEVPYDGAHQISGKVGVDWHLSFVKSIIIGFGFACNLSMADLRDGQTKDDVYWSPGGSLYDKETEFGWFARLNLPVWDLEKYRVGLTFTWEEIWTLPKRSDMLMTAVYVERKIW